MDTWYTLLQHLAAAIRAVTACPGLMDFRSVGSELGERTERPRGKRLTVDRTSVDVYLKLCSL